MPWNHRQDLQLAFCLLSIYVVRSNTGVIQPSNHGLRNEGDPSDPSPAMAAFFSGRPVAPLPVARNTTDPVWGVAGTVSPAQPPRDIRRRKDLLLIAGVSCGIIGVGILVAAAAYTVRTRSAGQPSGLQTGLGPASWAGPVRLRKRRENRLGAV